MKGSEYGGFSSNGGSAKVVFLSIFVVALIGSSILYLRGTDSPNQELQSAAHTTTESALRNQAELREQVVAENKARLVEAKKARLNDQRAALVARNQQANGYQEGSSPKPLTLPEPQTVSNSSTSQLGSITSSPKNLKANQAQYQRQQEQHSFDRAFSIPPFHGRADERGARTFLTNHFNRIGDEKLVHAAKKLRVKKGLVKHFQNSMKVGQQNQNASSKSGAIDTRLFEVRQRLIHEVTQAYISKHGA